MDKRISETLSRSAFWRMLTREL